MSLAMLLSLLPAAALAAEVPEEPEAAEAVEEAALVEDTEPVEETEAVEEAALVEDTEPVEETEAVEEAALVEEAEPVEETETVEEAEAVEDAALVEEAEPVEEAEAVEEAAALQAEPVYADGTYTGTGSGFGGNVLVEVTIAGGRISSVTSPSHAGESYWDLMGVDTLLTRIVEANTANVNGVSGATFSSNGVKAAVNNALTAAAAAAESGGSGSGGASSGQYVLMNIPYQAFYNAAGVTNQSYNYDAVSTATNKVGNYGITGGAFHSGTSASKAADDTISAVGGENGAKIEGVIWPVRVDNTAALSALGGREVTDSSKLTVATLGRGASSSTDLVGYETLMEAPAYSWYALDSEPANYLSLSIRGSAPVFTAGKDAAVKEDAIEPSVSYGTNWGDVQLGVSAAGDITGKLINAVVFTSNSGTVVGFQHLLNIWTNGQMAWRAALKPGLDGSTITNIRFYCSVKDDDNTDDTAPAYENYVYDYPVSLTVPAVYSGTLSAAFDGSSAITVTGLPADTRNPMAKVYYTTGGRGATYTYLTPLVVDPADGDIDPVSAPVSGGKIAIADKPVTVTSGDKSQSYGGPVDGTTYTIELSSDNYLFDKLSALYTAEAPTGSGYVLMNIPYADFYAAELNSGSPKVDAVTSASKQKPRTIGLAGGSYHKNADGSDISGVIFPVYVEDMSVLAGLTEVTDSTKVTITTTNRGTESTADFVGPDALFENPDYAYYKLSGAPAVYKTLSGSRGAFEFSAVSAKPSTVNGVTGEVSLGARHTDTEIKLAFPEGSAPSGNVSAVVLTVGSAKYGLRHVVNIWRGTELGWNLDELDLANKTITNIRYYTTEAVTDFPVTIAVGDASTATHTVTFYDGETVLSTTDVAHKTAVDKPSNPTKSGFTFENWYQDAALTRAYDFSSIVSRDLSLYANWTEAPDTPVPDPTPVGCYVATAVYGSYDCPEVWTLRRFRDQVLAKIWYGRLFIRLYYAVSPTAVRLFGESAWFQDFWRGNLDRMVSDLQNDGFSSTPYNDRNW